MENGHMDDTQEGSTKARNSSDWLRRNFPDSIYLWACGETVHDDDEDARPSDRIIGWLVLLVFAYAMIIVLASDASDTESPGKNTGRSLNLVGSVIGAMYLLVASTTHDLRAGFSLLVDDFGAGHRVFGMALLSMYGVMVTATMAVIVSTSDDNASVVLNSVTVLFIADLDEKALKFFSVVPQEWRLFWAMQSIGISVALAVVTLYIGDDSPLFEENSCNFAGLPGWMVWVLNPAGVTIISYRVSVWLKSCGAAFEHRAKPTFGVVLGVFLKGSLVTIKPDMECLREEPCFYVSRTVWLIQGLVSWLFVDSLIPRVYAAADNRCPDSSSSFSYEGPDKDPLYIRPGVTFKFVNAVLVTGFSLRILRYITARCERTTANSEPRIFSNVKVPRSRLSSWLDSRVPSLLVGWGMGYWVTSVLYLLMNAWPSGEWEGAPTAVAVLGYLFVPFFFVASIFMVAETSFLGSKFEALTKPSVQMMRNRHCVVYWLMATVLRDVTILWMFMCFYFLDSFL